MYNTNYKCVKPFDVWLDAIGPDGKKIPYRVKRGTIWRLVGIIVRTIIGCCIGCGT